MAMDDSYTAYFSPGMSLYTDDVSNGRDSNVLPRQFRELFEHPCLSYRAERAVMDEDDTRSIEPMLIGVATDNVRSFVVLKVTGNVKITTVGNDSDDETPLTGYTNCYGTAYLPGFMILMPYNLTSITLTALANSTVDILTGVLALSTDTRL